MSQPISVQDTLLTMDLENNVNISLKKVKIVLHYFLKGRFQSIITKKSILKILRHGKIRH